MRVFSETQRFDQWWVLALIYGIFLASLIGLILGVSKITNDNFSDFLIERVPPFIIMAFISVGFFILRLKTNIDKEGVYYGFWPFQKNLKLASWTEIDSVFIRKYKPLREFGGWGYRYSMNGNGKVYNVKGNMGIQIVFKDGKKTLIGTQKPEEAKQVIATYISKEKNYEN
tara:strand:+ start:9548 stop:10060 length:513 start_codon:yes stop_codon:yes gene_type:complete